MQPTTFSSNDESTCACLNGFSGEFCEMQIDACAMEQFELGVLAIDAVCLNGGVCISEGFVRDKNVLKSANKNGLTARRLGAKCKCPFGFTGSIKF